MAPPVPASRPLSPETLNRRFAPFPRLPAELRMMIWKLAIEEHSCLVVLDMGKKFYRSSFRFHPQSFESCRQTSPLVLVNQEARAIADSIDRRFIYKPHRSVIHRDVHMVFPDSDNTLPSAKRIGCVTDMFYLRARDDISKPLNIVIGGPLGNQLQKLAISFVASIDVNSPYITGEGLEDAIQGLPRLRQLYLVVEKLFNRNFGPGLVPRATRKYATLPGGLPYDRCPDHVTSRTELREHIKSQYDAGFGFSDYDSFTQRWQWPIGTPPGRLIPFRVYDANLRQIVARVHEISEKLQRRIDVKLMVDLDGKWGWGVGYERSDMNYRKLSPGEWYGRMCHYH